MTIYCKLLLFFKKKKVIYYFGYFALFFAFSCNTRSYVLSNNIFVEEIDSSVKDSNRYNIDNKIFTVGRKFIYEYSFLDKNGTKLYFHLKNNEWILSNEIDDTKSSLVLKNIVIQVLSGLKPMIDNDPDYNQTLISFKYPDFGKEYSISGVVENEKNIWMHPPRDGYLRILELNPFPYVKLPLEIDKVWDWNLTINTHWSDSKWKIFDSAQTNFYIYKVIDKEKIETPLGDLVCYKVESICKEGIGETKLSFLFNEKYGFVELHYKNIDGSKLFLKLQSIKD